MLEPTSKTKFNHALLTIRIVYFANILSLIIYLFIPNILHHFSFEGLVKFKEFDWLKNILYLISALTIVVILILKRFLDNSGKIPLTSESKIDEIIRPLISGNILIFALCETIALYGLVLFLIGSLLGEFYFLIGLSFVLFLICFPKQEKWQKIVNQFLVA
ncbi:MAG: hypothetical protein AB1422_11965 [bacterium]